MKRETLGWECVRPSLAAVAAVVLGMSVGSTQAYTTYSLDVTAGAGGTVTAANGEDNGINCGSNCTEDYKAKKLVVLRANPDEGYEFVRWGVDCRGSRPSARLRMKADKTCSATFVSVASETYTLTVQVMGGGTVTFDEQSCTEGSDCTVQYRAGSLVTLSAQANEGEEFWGWDTDCNGSRPSERVRMSGDRTCGAIFSGEGAPPEPDYIALYDSGHLGPAEFGGIEQMNQWCEETKPDGFTTSVAFVSTSTTDIRDLFPGSGSLPVMNKEGTEVVSSTWDNLWDGQIDQTLFEAGVLTYDIWVSGSWSDGVMAWLGSGFDDCTNLTCNDWTSSDPWSGAMVGDGGLDGNGSWWVDLSPTSCNVQYYALLCVAHP